MQFVSKSSQRHTVASINDWQRKRQQVLKGMQAVMGPLPQMPPVTPVARFADTLEAGRYTRYTAYLSVYEQEVVPVLLYLPKTNVQKPGAAVLVLHATGAAGKMLVDSLGGGPYDPIATELANQGYVVLAPDYPSFGASANYNFSTDRYASGTMKALFNHRRCIDYLQSLRQVDKNKIGVIGHSLGGHNAIFLGAMDERVKIVVSSCGWTLFGYYDAGQAVTDRFGGKLGPWAQERYMPWVREKFMMDASRMPFDFDEAIAAIAPRHFFSNSPLQDGNFSVAGVRQGVDNVRPVYKLLGVADHLQVYYPEAGHSFPSEIRQKAYAAMAEVLGQ